MNNIAKLILCVSIASAASASANTVIYTQTGCEPCTQAKNYLTKKGEDYKECNVAKPLCRQQFESYKGEGTPLIIINGIRVDGFDPEGIDKALNK